MVIDSLRSHTCTFPKTGTHRPITQLVSWAVRIDWQRIKCYIGHLANNIVTNLRQTDSRHSLSRIEEESRDSAGNAIYMKQVKLQDSYYQSIIFIFAVQLIVWL